MIHINEIKETPFKLLISFHKVLDEYKKMVESSKTNDLHHAKHVLKVADENPILREGFTDVNLLRTYESEISTILQDLFSPILTLNEIKTASVPFHDVVYNSSERFKNIVKQAGSSFELKMKEMSNNDMYIMSCAAILNFYYGYNINFKRPLYYEIPDAQNVVHYYKITYNADFTEIILNDESLRITEEDYYELLDNFENINLWKEKFPPNSYTFKGFVISNLFDVTDDQSISNIKSTLIGQDKRKDENFMDEFHEIFRSLLGQKELEVGFSIYNEEEDTFERVYGAGMNSFLLNKDDFKACHGALCSMSYNTLLEEKKFYTVSDVDKYYELSKGKAPQYRILKEQGFKSAILADILV